MIINPFFPNTEIPSDIHGDTIVYVPFLKKDDGEVVNLLCDKCYTTKSEAGEHFWFNKNFMYLKAEILTMTLSEFFKRHLNEVDGMNPFWDLGRLEFIEKYRHLYDTIS